VAIGYTTLYNLIADYYDAEGNLADPLAGTGADYVFISVDLQSFPEEQRTDTIIAVESALSTALKLEHSGRVLGWALGSQFAYIDLMLFNGRSSVQVVERVLREHNLPSGTSISFFAREKLSQRVVV
jgi:hypothetical protein